MSHDDFSPTFLGSSFNPVHIVAIDLYLLEPDLTASDEVRSDGRLPRAIRG
jgi:hypothetical protein